MKNYNLILKLIYMDIIKKPKKPGKVKKKKPVMDILKWKKSLTHKMKSNYKNYEKEFLWYIKQRGCFKDEEWHWFETKNWVLTDKWAQDVLDNFDEYAWEENTAHDQGFLSWYETAINDVCSYNLNDNKSITKDNFISLMNDNLYFLDILHFWIILEKEWYAELNLFFSKHKMIIKWDSEKFKFYSFDNIKKTKEVEINNLKGKHNLIELWKFISEKIIKFDEKWKNEK